MDPQQFDAFSRTFAQGSSRRQAMARIGAAGLLAGLTTAFGRGRAEALPAAQGETCRLAIVATVRLGPDATERMQTDVPGELRGELGFSLGPDGAIDAGRLLLDGGPEVPVVGQATGRAINLRANLQAVQEGLALVLVGTAEQPLTRCTGGIDGLLTGPLAGDLGDWHATATAIAGGTGTGAAPTPRPTPPPTPTGTEEQSCRAGLTRCGGVCVDRGNDIHNCGSCGVTCPGGAACIDGFCVCPPDRLAVCGGMCVDVNTDPGHCGVCGMVCESGLVATECRGGECVRADCAVGLEYCGAADLCRDLSSDPAHCGACGNACFPDQACVQGSCTCTADFPYFCGGRCVDVAFDPGNCGGCGITCAAGETCEFGFCQSSVPIADIPLDEAPPDEDSPCLPGLVYCGNNVCVDIFIDSFNCGGCGITCQFPQGCQGGECVG